ncbi:uncharacterized protein MKK02DRAFT_42806 [Dioszegia hungarica]|uniref:Cupredoxin n=1 Tax=Dioszegia hungarica TaxID=4972 RepID=A0AA38LXZ3_9TREE|nr:uncharacterized protein MKK02DRAFT_42806 [Dioszegia hungarica]KAI9638414.1 hypothetical protein MKK02DRAFT_42806 [Dioszegia hungarica]
MLSSLVATSLLVASVVMAATQQVVVGLNGTNVSTIPINIGVGDTVNFTFVAKNHTVSQSNFLNPCVPLAGGNAFSGFRPANITAGRTSNVLVNDTKPIWIYCAQGNHCVTGMVMSINAPATGNMTFEAYLARALAAAPPPAPGASGSPSSAPSGSAAPASSAPASSSGSEAASGTAPSPAASSKGAAAGGHSTMAASAGIFGAVLAGFALLL